MADPESATGSVPPCPQSVCSDPAIQPYIAALCRQQGWPAGHPVMIVGPEGKVCYCTCGGSAPQDAGAERLEVPHCPAEVCRAARYYIQEVCRDAKWPPGKPILLYNDDGTFCYCLCGEG
jgi:hypothetical protein